MAKRKNQITTSIDYNTFIDRIEQDITKFGKTENQWSFARNAVLYSPKNDTGNISNEQSNYKVAEVNYYQPSDVSKLVEKPIAKEDYRHKNENIKIIGLVYIQSDEWAVFSTDNKNSEIGLFKGDDTSYKRIVNSTLLNFNTSHLITGVGRMNHKCGRRIYWDDGVNPTRVLDIDDVPWVKNRKLVDSCYIEENTNVLDIDKLRLAMYIKPITINMSRGTVSGSLMNGAYFAVASYLIEDQRVSNYSIPSNTVNIYDHNNSAGSLEIKIESIDDTEFDEFELVLVQISNMHPVAIRVGKYSTRQSTITIDMLTDDLEKIQLDDIVRNHPVVDKADAMFRNGPYLLRVGPTDKLDFNYQPFANQIKTNWVSVEYPQDYYRDGGSNVGYMRDEVYSFFIQWIYKTGDRSRAYHIPGRVSTEDERKVNGFDDNLEILDYENKESYPLWKIKNTATIIDTNLEIAPDGVGVILGRGEMAYWESSEKYDDNKPEIWNASTLWDINGTAEKIFQKGMTATERNNYKNYDLCGKQIRHHKFPANDTDKSSNCITNHYSPNGYYYKVVESEGKKEIKEYLGTGIRVLGVEFSNIKPPIDNNGKAIKDIVGYEILRGNRYGNKTILAKGMLNNLREYKVNNSTKTFLYPNYPYNATNGMKVSRSVGIAGNYTQNDTAIDHFLSQERTEFNKTKDGYGAYLENDIPLGADKANFPNADGSGIRYGNVRQDIVSFHSPDTMFRKPYLTAKEVRVYGTMTGEMVGKFKVPKGIPRQKLITDSAFATSTIIGLGYAILKMMGEERSTVEAPQIDYGGTNAGAGTAGVFSTGLSGMSAISSALMTSTNVLATSANTIVANAINRGIISPILLSTGITPTTLSNGISNAMNAIAGGIGGKGGKQSRTTLSTPWSSTPLLIRTLNSFPIFANYWAGGVDDTFEMVYTWIPYRDYVLQQVSHGFYNGFKRATAGYSRAEIEDTAYVGGNIQDFASEYRINNLFRSRFVSLKLKEPLKLDENAKKDKSQATVTEVFPKNDLLKPEKFEDEFKRSIASYYVALKQRIDNQYGQLNSIILVPASNKVFDKPTGFISSYTATSEVVFGGDTYIGRYTEKNTMPFFYDWQNGEPDGTSYNFRLKHNVLHPRFWIDSYKFDASDFIKGISGLFGADESSSSFDVYKTNPIYTEEGGAMTKSDIQKKRTEGDGTSYYEIKTCDCESYKNDDNKGNDKAICYYSMTSKLNKLFKKVCKASDTLERAMAEQNWLEAAACYYHKSITINKYKEGKDEECTPCNADNNSITDMVDDDYKTYDIKSKSATRFGRKNFSKISSGKKRWKKMRDRYNCNDEGAITRILRRAQNKVKKAQKKYDKMVQKLQDAYIDTISGTSSKGFVTKLKEKIFSSPTDKYALDMNTIWGKFNFGVSGGYMYLFNSGVRDFFVESEINIDFRDYGDGANERFYDHREYTDLDEIFSTDNIKSTNFMKYDMSYSVGKQFHTLARGKWGLMQDTDYDPYLAESCYTYRPKRIIYSLPQYEEGTKDHWRVFPTLDYKDFTSRPTAVKQFGKMSAMITFETESPIYFDGIDQITTDSGAKYNIGDGGLFSGMGLQMSQSELAHEYGSCKDSLSIINTPYGVFYISQDQGKIFEANYGSQLQEITWAGLKNWFYKYLPYKLTQDKEMFADVEFELVNNPVVGIGCQAIFDNSTQTIFFCKKDYKALDSKKDSLLYKGAGKFIDINTNGTVKLGDPMYFEDASWTISYNPLTKNGAFVSWHDWHPDMVIPSKDTFMTIKNNGIWMHNDNCQSYCNFYGKDYPFEIEFELVPDSIEVDTLRNVYYVMEAYVYDENCQDRFHVLDENFDEAIIYNSEQCSGLLKLKITPKNDPINNVNYPIIGNDSITILVSKEEQIYRFNQFFDITADRGEFEKNGVMAQRTIFKTEANGYVKNLNESNLNYEKSSLEHKKFRHIKQNIILRKTVSGNKNLVLSMSLIKKLNSNR